MLNAEPRQRQASPSVKEHQLSGELVVNDGMKLVERLGKPCGGAWAARRVELRKWLAHEICN